MVRDELAQERYDREVQRTIETAEKVRRDAQEAYEEGAMTKQQRDKLVEAATEYSDGTIRLLRKIYLS